MLEMHGESSARRQPMSLAAHLLLLTLAVALPIVTLAFFALNHAVEAQRQTLRDGLVAHARTLSSLVSSRVDDFIIAGRVLSHSRLLARGDYAGFNVQAEAILPNIAAHGIEVLGKNGELLAHTQAVVSSNLPGRSSSGIPRALSDVMPVARNKSHIVRVNVPVAASGDGSYISIIVATSEFQKLIEGQSYDKAWVLGLLDRQLHFVARLPDASRVGTPASETWQAALRSGAEGLQEITTLEGDKTLTAYTQTAQGWTVGVAVPLSVLDEPVQTSRQQFALTAALSLIASLLIAILVGKRLTAKAVIIEGAARRLALDGEVPDRTTGILEYDKLVASLRESAGLLNQRKIERDNFEQSQMRGARLLQAALDVAEIAVYEWNPETDVVHCGQQFRDMWGIAGEDTIHSRQLMRTIVGADRVVISRDILRALDPESDGLFAAEFRVERPDGAGERWFYCRSRTEFENGRAVRVIGAARDVTERRQREFELETQRQELRTLANAMPQLVWVADGAGNLLYFNENRALYASGGSGLMDWSVMIHPDDLVATNEQWQLALKTGTSYSCEHRLALADGTFAWHLSRALPTRDDHGEIVRWHGTATNIHEHRLREQHIRVLLAEVNHRSKNLLAVVQAIVRQTAKTSASTAEFSENFNARVKALATSQELITAQDWHGVAMADLARSQLDHYAELVGSRITIDGPDVMVGPEVAQAIGMALHELSTNASKYGSLSNAVGTVAISWVIETRKDEIIFEICWREQGGPMVEKPVRTGFGSFVIDRMLSGRFGADINLAYEPEGLKWTFSAPLKSVLAAPGGNFAAT